MSTQKPSYSDFFRTFLKLSHLRLWITHVRNDEQKYHLKLNYIKVTCIFLGCQAKTTSRVQTHFGKHGKSLNFIMIFHRTKKTCKKIPDPGKSWKSVDLEEYTFSFQN